MKNLKLVILCTLVSFTLFAQKPQKRYLLLWSGYRYFVLDPTTETSLFKYYNNNHIVPLGKVYLGDTIEWVKISRGDTEMFPINHTISSDTVPDGAASFDYQWKDNVDTLFTYIPTKVGLYKYNCKPHSSRDAIGMNGMFSVVGTSLTGINEAEITYSSSQMLYPNPAKNVVNVPLNKSIKYSLAIINAKGETLKTVKVENTELYELEVSHLPSGFYYVNAGFCGCSTPKKGCTGAKRSFKFFKE